MALLSVSGEGDCATFDQAECIQAGLSLAGQYTSGDPFPHIVIEEFLDPDMLRTMLNDFPKTDGKTYFDRDQERYKYQFSPHEIAADGLRNLLISLNSAEFLTFLENLTGISGLIPDPYFAGGGLHETKSGGHLSVHADFNVHEKLKLERRLNLLIYLNDDWPPDYGGALELWDQGMKECRVSVAPVLARAVVFNTSRDSFHGQPAKLTCPPNRSRRSIATYYYTAPEEGIASLPKRTTNFRQRPGAGDKRDWKIGYKHLVGDWVPPRLQKYVLRLIR
jgi:Rps23 Pro-64 3,4-dihydroxylase Tpa1-like proline 4-hydroxylase